MPTVITPSAGEVFPLNLTGPADGDLANAASVNGAFQAIVNGLDVSRLGLFGARLRPRYWVSNDGNGSSIHPQITVEPLGNIILTTGGGAIWGAINHAVTSVIDVEAKFGAQIPVKTRIYLYAYVNSGVLDWIVNTSPPAANLRYGATTDQVYIGTALGQRTATGKLHFSSEYGGVHRIHSDEGLSGGLPVVQSNSQSLLPFPVMSNAAYGQIVPAYARVIKFAYTTGYTGTPTGQGFTVYADNGGTIAVAGAGYPTTGHAIQFDAAPLDLTNLYYLAVTDAGPGQSNQIDVIGWYDPR